MFGKLMNSYFYGKSGKGDFTPDDLPKNRWELFFSMLRIRLSALTRLNLMTFIAFLPLMIIFVYSVMSVIMGWNSALAYDEALRSGTELDPETYTESMLALYAQFTTDGVFQLSRFLQELFQIFMQQLCLWLIPAILITGPVETGLAYVCRNWARDEHAFIWSDFKDAVKENWKQGLGISLITSVIPLIVYVAWQFYGEMSSRSMFFMVPQVLVAMLGVLWMLGLVFFYPLIVSYRISFPQLIKNGILLSIARLPQTVGIRLIVLVPILILAVFFLFTSFGMYALLIIGMYYIILGITLKRFIFASFTNAVFDRYINSKIEGARVNRGLAADDDDEEEEEEEKSIDEEQRDKPEQ